MEKTEPTFAIITVVNSYLFVHSYSQKKKKVNVFQRERDSR